MINQIKISTHLKNSQRSYILLLLKKATLLLFLISLYACFESETNKAPIDQGARSPGSQDSDTIPMIWDLSKKQSGITLVIAEELLDSLPAKYYQSDSDNIIIDMKKAWDDSVEDQQLFSFSQLTAPNKDLSDLRDYRDGQMGIYFSESWYQEVGSQALGITQFFGTRRNRGTSSEYIELAHADIIINLSLNNMVWDNNDISGFDIPSVILHELGHFLGLPHEDSSRSAVMQPFLSVHHRYRQLFEADREAIKDNYQHSSSQRLNIFALQSDRKAISSLPDQEVRGIIELRKTGECLHYLDGELIYKHSVGPHF